VDEMDTTIIQTTLTPDARAEFRLATDLKSAKEINHDLTAQVSQFSFYATLHILPPSFIYIFLFRSFLTFLSPPFLPPFFLTFFSFLIDQLKLGVVKRQLSDMHKHHERTLAKLKEENTWSINHLKRSFEKEKEVLRAQLEIEIRKQISNLFFFIF
jgi:hypothetical protein